MQRKTTTRADLANAIHRKVGLSLPDSAAMLEQVLEMMTAELITGTPVKIAKFGTFKVRHKRERAGRNPRTLTPANISARRVLVF